MPDLLAKRRGQPCQRGQRQLGVFGMKAVLAVPWDKCRRSGLGSAVRPWPAARRLEFERPLPLRLSAWPVFRPVCDRRELAGELRQRGAASIESLPRRDGGEAFDERDRRHPSKLPSPLVLVARDERVDQVRPAHFGSVYLQSW